MKYTHVIWDFNGTILDDVECGVESVNTLLSQRGLKELEGVDAYRKVFGFPVIDYYKRLGFDFDKEPYSVIALLWVDLYLENVKKAGLFNDVKETIDAFRNMGISQTVLSATELNMLMGQLEYLKIADCFDEILGLDNIHAESKVALGKAWQERNKGAVTILIGDTVHDAETAEQIGADCILVARGHQSFETLKERTPYVVKDIHEALELMERL